MFIVGVAGREGLLEERESSVFNEMAKMAGRIHRMIDGRPPVDYPMT